MLFERGEFIFKFTRYLGFEWEQHFYVLPVLPFGLASAPYVFTKLLCPPVKLWQSRGFKALMNGKECAEKASMRVNHRLTDHDLSNLSH